MIPEIRRAYNAAFTEERYLGLVRGLEAAAGFPIEFRISETPLFLSAEMTRELEAAAWEIFGQVTSAEYLRQADRAVPPELAVPGDEKHPVFLQIDFALASDESGGVVPQLIELQGFPSLYGFQWLLDREFREHFPIPSGLSPYFDGLDAVTYPQRLREVIVDGCDPENVVLLEIEPEKQKTRVDFAVTEQLLGIRTVGASEVIERGGRLFYPKDGREVPIRRIYNRVIFDEMLRKGMRLDHLFRRELVDVEWVGHPNWYLKISKFSLPFLRSKYAPPTYLLDGLTEYPDDLERWVLKPLYSFAGLGVELAPTVERLRSIENPADYILQRRVDYAPLIETPDGHAKAEIRMMFAWKDEPRLINNLVRMSKGAMMGVDFNKNKTWIGASLAYHPVP
jgi:hypothetical protein